MSALLARFVVEGYADVETCLAQDLDDVAGMAAGQVMRFALELIDAGAKPETVLELKKLGHELGVARRDAMQRERRARRRGLRRVA